MLYEAISTEIRDDLNETRLNVGWAGGVYAKLRKSFKELILPTPRHNI